MDRGNMGEEQVVAAGSGHLVGQTVGGHEIVSLIGAGGMGEVYLARQKSIGTMRAIKVIHDDHRADDDAFARFGIEAVALARLQHHNIIQIIEFGKLDNGWPYLCMEYVEGQTLDKWISDGGPMPLGDALRVLGQLCHALAYAHGAGVIHRDLKPANTLMRHGDPRQVKVIDFGLALMISEGMVTRLTAEHQVMGSPHYISPEQAVGAFEISGAADVYALAGIAYMMLSGKPVFPDLPVLQMVRAHVRETPMRLSTRAPKLPRRLDELLYACLAKKPGDRPTARELDAEVAAIARSLESDPALAATLAPTPESAAATTLQSSAADLLLGGALGSDSSVRSALINQALAVVDDIAATLAPRDDHIGRLYRRARELDDRTIDLEMEIAVLDAEAGDPPRRDALWEERLALGTELAEARRALVCYAEQAPGAGDDDVRELRLELDALLSRLRAEVGST